MELVWFKSKELKLAIVLDVMRVSHKIAFFEYQTFLRFISNGHYQVEDIKFTTIERGKQLPAKTKLLI